jgi:hypothetical protein
LTGERDSELLGLAGYLKMPSRNFAMREKLIYFFAASLGTAMTEPEDDNSPWVHIGECPVCVNGIVRVRTCHGGGETHLIAVCDECEAIWTDPDISNRRGFADAEKALCPICDQPLYGPQSHWSVPIDLQGTEWAAASILAWPSGDSDDEQVELDARQAPPQSAEQRDEAKRDTDDLVEPEDRATGC